MKTIIAIVATIAASAVFGGDFTLLESVSGKEFDWKNGANYEGGTAPGDNDTLIIPSGVTAKLSASSDSFGFVNKLFRITPKDGAVLEVTVGEGVEKKLNCAVSVLGEVEETGKLVKYGPGELEFAGYGKIRPSDLNKDYYVNIEVKEGKLALYQGGSSNTECFYARNVKVSEGAELSLCKIGYTYAATLSGNGLVTKEDTTDEQRLWLNGSGHSVFDGYMVGNIRIDLEAGRHDFTCPTNNINTIIVRGTAVSGMTSFGDAKQVSSFGVGNVNFTGAEGGVIYLGEVPSVCGKDWWLSSHCFMDAGTCGGIEFSGKFGYGASTDLYLRGLELKGDNANECVISGTIPSSDSVRSLAYITKSGSGKWRFAATNENARGAIGVIDVREGTIGFDSIAGKGANCSLGPGNLWYGPTYSLASAGTPVDYAFVLGGIAGTESEPTEGIMEYSGLENGFCSTRPFAIRSRGRIKSSGGSLCFSGVFALGSGEKTLTLDSSGTMDNAVTRLSDGTGGGRLSVEKDGEGTWRLWGENTATGSLFARKGTAVLLNKPAGKKYRWYRFVVTENAYACDRYDTTYSVGIDGKGNPKAISDEEKGLTQIQGIALYDIDGNNLVNGFQQKDPITQFDYENGDANIMEAKEVAIGRLGTFARWTDFSQTLDNLCGGGSTGYPATGGLTSSNGGIYPDKPETHLPIVFRLPDDAAEVVRVDFAWSLKSDGSAANAASYNGRNITAFRLDASIDGIHWDLGVAREDKIEVPQTPKVWYSDPSVQYSQWTKRPGCGIEIGQAETTSGDSYAFSSYGAANGAKIKVVGDALEISGLRVDASAEAGTLENLSLAENGIIDVFNLEQTRGPVDLPVNVSALGGKSNIANYLVRINGRPVGWNCSLNADGTLRISPKGAYLIIR